MSDYEIEVDGLVTDPLPGWNVEWLDRRAGIARLSDGRQAITVVVEGEGQEWWVTLRGRRVPVSVRTWRERVLAEAEVGAGTLAVAIDVKATLPGLVVAVAVREGDEVAQGDPLLTIEAMKMQNEVRAPRDGRIVAVAVQAGLAVATGALLIRLE